MAAKASSKFQALSEIPISEAGSSPDLEQEISKALLNIPAEDDALLSRRYGLGSGVPCSIEEEAREKHCSSDEIREKEANALRLLMGYGKRIS